jgi:muconolactone delta-isomerase
MEATVDYLKQMKQSGKILEAYALAGSEQTMTISELDSPGEIAQMIAGVPMGAFINFETYPLADFEEMMNYQIESAKKAEQLFPPK